MSKRAPALAASLAAVLLIVVAWIVCARQETTPESREPAEQLAPVSWSELQFKASKLLLSATATVQTDTLPAEEVAGGLRSIAKGTAVPLRTSEVRRVVIRSELPFGKSEVAVAWLDPQTGCALQSEKDVAGGKQYWKVRRYAEEGYFQWRAEPADRREKKLERDSWTRTSKGLVPWDQAPPQGTVITDSYALLYLLSAARLDREGSTLKIVIFSKKHLVELEFTAHELVSREVGFVEVSGDGERRRSGKVRARRVTGSGRLLAGGDNAADDEVELGFLGMQGDLVVFLEEGTGMPLEVNGRAEHIGKVRVALKRATLGEPATGGS